jgi:hypothetical protein
MSEKLETGSFWCENSLVGVKTNFHVNLTCFHTKSTRFHTKVWCELNPCFFLCYPTARCPNPTTVNDKKTKSNDKKPKKKPKSNAGGAGGAACSAGGLSSVWCGVLTMFLDSDDEEA